MIECVTNAWIHYLKADLNGHKQLEVFCAAQLFSVVLYAIKRFAALAIGFRAKS